MNVINLYLANTAINKLKKILRGSKFVTCRDYLPVMRTITKEYGMKNLSIMDKKKNEIIIKFNICGECHIYTYSFVNKDFIIKVKHKEGI